MTRIAWCIKNSALLVAYENGKMALYDTKTLEKTKEWEAHTATITSMTFNAEKTLLITSSTDQTAKLWDTATWNVIRTYNADTPLNCVSMSPIKEHVIMGGGQEAMKVTTTRLDEGKFQTRFYHMVTGKELGRVKGHFGTMNTLAFNPDGRSFASGGEDGFIRLYPLDEDYEHLGEEEDKDLDDAELGKLLAEGALERLLAEEEAAKRKAAAAEAAALAVYGAK
jgi:translation initiation factor 3 subunit I